MSTPILLTKLFIPENRPELVSRSHLVDQLNNGLHHKLTLISAPAGFGKTTVVTNWLHSQQGDEEPPFLIGWLSLDEDDNDPVRFLTYLITALNRIPGLETEIGFGALQIAQAPQPPPPQTILTAVLNEITLITNKIVLVLDDYHLIDSQPVHDALIFLLENLPPQLHIVITTREDPPLQISRLRTRGQLNEFRAVHLRFSTAETDEFLNQIMGLGLSTQDITALEKRTEGWVAGLQLAAISMQGRTDISNFIQSFTGSHHFVIDYLVEEVLKHQPEHIRDFLLQTSILDRLTGPLCDAITSQENGQATLEILEHSNLFIIRLDSERQWYRYHHLFSDSLLQRLKQSTQDQEKPLHLKASEWYAQNGFPDQAIEHALQAEDFDRAVRLIEKQADACWKGGEHKELQSWLDALPVDLLLSNPNLCVFQAWEQFVNEQQDAVETTLQALEKLDLTQECQNESERMRIQGRAATIRAFLAFHKGDPDAIFQYAQLALDYLPEDDIIWRNTIYVPLGDAYQMARPVEDTARIRFETWETSKKIGNIYMNIIASMKYCVTLRQQGEFDMIKDICQQQMTLAKENGLSLSPEAGWILAVWGEVLAEQGDLDQAIKKTREGVELAPGGYIGILGVCKRHLIVALYSSGHFAGVEAIIQEIEENGWDRLPPWVVTEIKAWQLRLWLAQGKIEETSQWLAEQGLEVTGNPDRFNEMEYLILVRFLIATGHPSDTLDLLKRVYTNANDRGHISRVIEVLNLQALAMQAVGDTRQAINVLEQSLALAEPRGFLFAFVNEGPPMARLLYEALSREIAPEYVQKLLAAFPDVEPEKEVMSQPIVIDSEWIEPLSERELEVLQLIAEGLSRQEIATKLVLSLNTVKTHARNVYSKLGVNNQMQAVGKARGLGLLDQD
jgi:LuxR family maltose regulon positive regulatory protein